MLKKSFQNHYFLGSYPENGESIEWKYIEMGMHDEQKIFLAQNGLAVFPYKKLLDGQNANKLKRCYYQNSDLHDWLNGEFLEMFFTTKERKLIKSVLIPSAEDITKWFPKKVNRVCAASNYAIKNGAAIFDSYCGEKACAYWLSDTGRKEGMSTTVVMADGKFYKSAYLAATNVCVRPVIELYGGE